MDNLLNSSKDKGLKHILNFHGTSFMNVEISDFVKEGIVIMNIYNHSIASHCIRVSCYSTGIGDRMNLSENDLRELWGGAVFHDIGKIYIPQEILQKPGKLTKDEYETVKTHSLIGYEYMKNNRHMENIAAVLLYHHERFDGKGYPKGISGYSIPLFSRIIAVADAFDAMTSDRPYRAPMSYDEALTELSNEKWKQFDGDIVNCFIDLVEDSFHNLPELNSIRSYR